jgi:hypothetical protein
MPGWLQALVVIGFVGVLHVPPGDYMARAFTARRHWRGPAADLRRRRLSRSSYRSLT